MNHFDMLDGAMQAEGVPLATIAADCGFADQAHFSRSFRAAYGVPPSRFRRERR